MSEFLDFVGRTLELGDTVAFIEPGYRSLIKGKIYAFTPQRIRIEYTKGKYPYKIIQEGDQLIKVIE